MISRKPAHLLLVDDDPGLLKLLGMRLTSEGYSVVTAESGQEGLRVLNREKVDLVLTDINMPDINGLELISYMRNNPNYQDIPIIIISTEGSQKDVERGKLLGANDYVVKPFDPATLQKLLQKYLNKA